MSPSIGQIILIILVILLIFGAGRLPRLMEDLAKGMKAFKKGMDDNGSKPSKISNKSVSSKKGRVTAATNQGELSDQKIVVFPAKRISRPTQNKTNPVGQISARAETSHSLTSKSDKTARVPSAAQSVSKTKPFVTPHHDQNTVDSGGHTDRPATKDSVKKSVIKVTGQNTGTKSSGSRTTGSRTTGSKTTGSTVDKPNPKSKTTQKKALTKPITNQSTTQQKTSTKATVSKGATAKNTATKSGPAKKRVVKKTK